MWQLPDGTSTSVCPFKTMVKDEHLVLLRLYRHYVRGVLPVSGGLYDQSAYYVEAMEVIDKAMSSGKR